MTKRLQINVRSNEYLENLMAAVLEKENDLDKTKFVHSAIERLAFEILGPEEIMNIRMYQHFDNRGI